MKTNTMRILNIEPVDYGTFPEELAAKKVRFDAILARLDAQTFDDQTEEDIEWLMEKSQSFYALLWWAANAQKAYEDHIESQYRELVNARLQLQEAYGYDDEDRRDD